MRQDRAFGCVCASLSLVGQPTPIRQHASQADADRLDQLVNAAIMELDDPPAGLMAHIGHPSGTGFVICDVWRSEADMRSFYDKIVLPKLAEANLQADKPVISPAWSFARP